MTQILPSLVILGRPNVGKSTLFNRLTGTRRSIVTNEPGITRDRIYGKAEWRGKALEIVDTGGIVPDDKALIPTEILRQAHVAIKKAALLVLVVDSQAGVTPLGSRAGAAFADHWQAFCSGGEQSGCGFAGSECGGVSFVGRSRVSDCGGTWYGR